MNTPPAWFSSLLTPVFVMLLAAGALLEGCQSVAESGKAGAQAPTTANKPAQPGSFSADTLYSLLVGELAGQRNQYDVALNNYLEQAKFTHDPGVAERAYRIAQYLQDDKAAHDSALIWAKAAPQDDDAQRAAALSLASAGHYQQAMDYMVPLLKNGLQAHFDYLAEAAADADPATRNKLINSLDQLSHQYPDNSELIFGRALLLHQAGRNQQALGLLEGRHEPSLISLRASILQQLGHDNEALSLLRRGSKAHPEDKLLGQNYARMLLARGELKQGKAEYRRLLERYPDDDELLYALALLSTKTDDDDETQGYLEELVIRGSHLEAAHYYLGDLYQKRKDINNAIDEYQQVPPGSYYPVAQLQLAKMLISNNRAKEAANILADARKEHPDLDSQLYQVEVQAYIDLDQLPDAWRVLHQGLTEFPEDTDLLYYRAMLAEKRNDLPQMEKDLRHIIKLDPDNAMAINALGYILADRTTRYSEARELIEKAHRLDPDDPAVLDSLGWVNYRLGHLKEAESYLRTALDQYPDAEVAAHLGEVLWTAGNKDGARQVWRRGLSNPGDQQTLFKTIKRLTGSATP